MGQITASLMMKSYIWGVIIRLKWTWLDSRIPETI